MPLRNAAIVLAAAGFVAACQAGGGGGQTSNRPQAQQLAVVPPTKMPRYGDALSGLYPIPAGGLPSDIPINYYAVGGGTGKPGRPVLTMALVPGANYAKLRDYLAQADKDIARAPPGWGPSDLRLQPVLKQAVDIVRERYPWIELTDDLATAQKRDVSLTLVLDIRARLATKGADATVVRIELVAFNDQHKPIAHFVSEGGAKAGGPEGYNFSTAAQQALAGFAQKASRYFD